MSNRPQYTYFDEIKRRGGEPIPQNTSVPTIGLWEFLDLFFSFFTDHTAYQIKAAAYDLDISTPLNREAPTPELAAAATAAEDIMQQNGALTAQDVHNILQDTFFNNPSLLRPDLTQAIAENQEYRTLFDIILDQTNTYNQENQTALDPYMIANDMFGNRLLNSTTTNIDIQNFINKTGDLTQKYGHQILASFVIKGGGPSIDNNGDGIINPEDGDTLGFLERVAQNLGIEVSSINPLDSAHFTALQEAIEREQEIARNTAIAHSLLWAPTIQEQAQAAMVEAGIALQTPQTQTGPALTAGPAP